MQFIMVLQEWEPVSLQQEENSREQTKERGKKRARQMEAETGRLERREEQREKSREERTGEDEWEMRGWGRDTADDQVLKVNHL